MKSTFSYWENSSFKNFDTIIIGSGIVGLNTAISLKLQNPILSICVIESGYLPAGASTKNAGFACFGSVSELIEQEDLAGEEGLAKLITKRWNGLSYLRKLLSDKAIDFRNYGGYEIFTKSENNLAQKSVAKIEHFNQLIKNIVGKDAFKLDNTKINQFGFSHIETLIFNQFEGQIDTGKMMLALLQKAQSLGVLIFNNCTAQSYQNNTNTISLITDRGLYTCKKLIVATNAFIKNLLPSVDIEPGRGQVLITKPIKNLQLKAHFITTRVITILEILMIAFCLEVEEI